MHGGNIRRHWTTQKTGVILWLEQAIEVCPGEIKKVDNVTGLARTILHRIGQRAAE
jgi:hypothetical protein